MPQLQTHDEQQLQRQDGKKLHHAELKYYSCKFRVQDMINNLEPQDPTSRYIANAGLQELITLGLNYRFIRSEEARSETPSGLGRA